MDELVDVTLVDETLSMTVEQRLLQNDRMVRSVQDLREALTATRLGTDERVE
jgi:hypothetical protein